MGQPYDAFDNWWSEHYSMANLARGAAEDAWKAATLAERERCAKIADEYDTGWTRFGPNIAAAIRTGTTKCSDNRGRI